MTKVFSQGAPVHRPFRNSVLSNAGNRFSTHLNLIQQFWIEHKDLI
jgi:hypothetical protein